MRSGSRRVVLCQRPNTLQRNPRGGGPLRGQGAKSTPYACKVVTMCKSAAASAEPVQFPDDQAIAGGRRERLLESWAIIPRPAGLI